MTLKKYIINTKSREIYDKFNRLNIDDVVVFDNVKEETIVRMLKSINKTNKTLQLSILDGKFSLRKINPMRFDAYMTKDKKKPDIFLKK